MFSSTTRGDQNKYWKFRVLRENSLFTWYLKNLSLSLSLPLPPPLSPPSLSPLFLPSLSFCLSLFWLGSKHQLINPLSLSCTLLFGPCGGMQVALVGLFVLFTSFFTVIGTGVLHNDIDTPGSGGGGGEGGGLLFSKCNYLAVCFCPRLDMGWLTMFLFSKLFLFCLSSYLLISKRCGHVLRCGSFWVFFFFFCLLFSNWHHITLLSYIDLACWACLRTTSG